MELPFKKVIAPNVCLSKKKFLSFKVCRRSAKLCARVVFGTGTLSRISLRSQCKDAILEFSTSLPGPPFSAHSTAQVSDKILIDPFASLDAAHTLPMRFDGKASRGYYSSQ